MSGSTTARQPAWSDAFHRGALELFASDCDISDQRLVATLFAIVLLCYGGGFGTMPSFVADWFGTRYMGVNYGWILSAWGAGGIAGPIFVAAVKDRTGSFSGALPAIAAILLGAMVLPLVARRPGGRRSLPAPAPP